FHTQRRLSSKETTLPTPTAIRVAQPGVTPSKKTASNSKGIAVVMTEAALERRTFGKGRGGRRGPLDVPGIAYTVPANGATNKLWRPCPRTMNGTPGSTHTQGKRLMSQM